MDIPINHQAAYEFIRRLIASQRGAWVSLDTILITYRFLRNAEEASRWVAAVCKGCCNPAVRATWGHDRVEVVFLKNYVLVFPAHEESPWSLRVSYLAWNSFSRKFLE